jgi:hypothetical protein
MKDKSRLAIIISALFFITLFVGCGSNKPQLNSISESEEEWNRAFSEFISKLPNCPKGNHTLIAGNNPIHRFGGSCFQCRKQLGITETKVNKFTGTRKTITAKTYTCSQGCIYNICQKCAEL